MRLYINFIQQLVKVKLTDDFVPGRFRLITSVAIFGTVMKTRKLEFVS